MESFLYHGTNKAQFARPIVQMYEMFEMFPPIQVDLILF